MAAIEHSKRQTALLAVGTFEPDTQEVRIEGSLLLTMLTNISNH